jgi:outer membrane immunogenic protein
VPLLLQQKSARSTILGLIQEPSRPPDEGGVSMKLLLVTALIAGSAVAARAADLRVPVKAPVVAPAYSWAGPYVGFQAGYGWSNDLKVAAVPNAPFANDFSGTTAFIAANHPSGLTLDGFTGGVQAGYNWQSGNLVYGVEADISYTDFRKSFEFGAGNIIPLSVAGQVKSDWLATLRARGLCGQQLALLPDRGSRACGCEVFGIRCSRWQR